MIYIEISSETYVFAEEKWIRKIAGVHKCTDQELKQLSSPFDERAEDVKNLLKDDLYCPNDFYIDGSPTDFRIHYKEG
jgi:hypothetical protein